MVYRWSGGSALEALGAQQADGQCVNHVQRPSGPEAGRPLNRPPLPPLRAAHAVPGPGVSSGLPSSALLSRQQALPAPAPWPSMLGTPHVWHQCRQADRKNNEHLTQDSISEDWLENESTNLTGLGAQEGQWHCHRPTAGGWPRTIRVAGTVPAMCTGLTEGCSAERSSCCTVHTGSSAHLPSSPLGVLVHRLLVIVLSC